MVRPSLDLVVPEKCSHCKLKSENLCEGYLLAKGTILVSCPSFVDKRSQKPIDVLHCPFPVKKKERKN